MSKIIFLLSASASRSLFIACSFGAYAHSGQTNHLSRHFQTLFIKRIAKTQSYMKVHRSDSIQGTDYIVNDYIDYIVLFS